VRSLLDQLALGTTAAGGAALAAAILFAHSWRAGLGMALDLWLAAGLLRLAEPPDVGRLVSVAAIVAIRQVVGLGLRHGSRPGGGSLARSTETAATPSAATKRTKRVR
jgi:hypothetical protein